MKLWTVSLALLFPLACGDGRTDVISGADADPNAPDADLTSPDADPNAPDADPFAPDADLNVTDLVGPNIVIVNPVAGSIVGSFVTIQADITDDSAIVAPVMATWGIGLMSLAEVELDHQGGGRYSAPYATADLRSAVDMIFMGDPNPPQLVNPSLTVRASDSQNNESVVGVQVVMDYTPPLLSLNPPPVREGMLVAGVYECSAPFDPLGDDAVNDLETYYQLSEIRARVQDLGNSGTFTSEIVTFKAGIDPSTVQLFVLGTPGATTEALVVDMDADGECDDINPAYLQPNNEVVVINLAGVESAGSSHFIADVGQIPGDRYPSPGLWSECYAPADAPDPPDPVCQFTSLLSRIIADPIDPSPIIYGIPPLSELVCLGPPFDSVANNIADGWACIAVRALDFLGNVGVSAPVRVCFDWNRGKEIPCTLDPGSKYLPPAFDCLGTNIANSIDANVPCQAHDYQAGEVIQLP